MKIIKRELKLFSRSGGWLMAIIFPVIIVLTIGLAISGSLSGIPIAIVGDNDVTDSFLESMKENSKFSISEKVESFNIEDSMKQGRFRAAIKVINTSMQLDVTIYLDVTDQTVKEQLEYLIITDVYNSFGKYGEILTINIVELYSNKDFFAYITPGVLALSILSGGLFGASETILKEKDSKTLENVILSNFNPVRFIAEKIISFMVTMSIISIMCFLLIVSFTGIPTFEGMIGLIIIVILAEFIFVSLGITLSTFVPNEEVSGEMLAVVQFPMMFISGSLFSIYQMNPIVVPIAGLNPLTHIVEAFKALLLKSATFTDVLGTIFYLIGIGSCIFFIAVILMYRTIKKIQN